MNLNQNLDLNLDRCYLAILQKTRGGFVFAERAEADAASRNETIRDLIAGQVEDVAAVIEFNAVEGTARDVTEDIAIALADTLDPSVPLRRDLHDFIETHAPAHARGLRVADRTFAAA